MQKHGFENLYGAGGVTSAVIKHGAPIPEGWRQNRTAKGCDGVAIMPDAKQKATYKQLKAELEALPRTPDSFQFSSELGFGGYFRGMTIMWASMGKIGDAFVIAIPDMSAAVKESLMQRGGKPPVQFIPPDCTPLKHSRYYAMVEAEEEKQRTAAPASTEAQPVTT